MTATVGGSGGSRGADPIDQLVATTRRRLALFTLALVIGGVWYGISRHQSKGDDTAGLCTTKVSGLSVVLTATQARNASLISAIAVRRGMPAHAATIAGHSRASIAAIIFFRRRGTG